MNQEKNFSEEEWDNRVNLAACYHLADHFGWSDIIWNHITTKTSKNKNTFLINKKVSCTHLQNTFTQF